MSDAERPFSWKGSQSVKAGQGNYLFTQYFYNQKRALGQEAGWESIRQTWLVLPARGDNVLSWATTARPSNFPTP